MRNLIKIISKNYYCLNFSPDVLISKTDSNAFITLINKFKISKMLQQISCHVSIIQI